MPRSLRWGIGIALILVAGVVYSAEQTWMRSRTFWPVRMPVSVDGTTRTGPFQVNVPDGYNIEIWVDSFAVSEASEQNHPECKKCCGYAANPKLTKKWQLFRGGRLTQSGETEGSQLAIFSGKGTYDLQVQFPGASPCWQLGNPQLVIYTWASYSALDRNTEIICFMLVCGGIIWLIVPLAMRTMGNWASGDDARVEPGFESNNVELRRRERLPLRRRISLLPDRSVLFGGPVLLMLLVMVVLTTPPTSRGIYVTLVVPSSTPAPTSTEAAVVVQVERGDRKDSGWVARYRVQGKAVAPSALSEVLKHELARRNPWVVYVYGDEDLPYADVMYAVGVINELHAHAVLVGKRGNPSVMR